MIVEHNPDEKVVYWTVLLGLTGHGLRSQTVRKGLNGCVGLCSAIIWAQDILKIGDYFALYV